MAGKTVQDLKALQIELFERRYKEAYRWANTHQDKDMERLVLVHLAIEALEKVIAEGKDGPETDVSTMIG
jgi:hypothetical protein